MKEADHSRKRLNILKNRLKPSLIKQDLCNINAEGTLCKLPYNCLWVRFYKMNCGSLNPIQDEGGVAKSPPPLPRISPKNFMTFSFDPFDTLV